MFWYYLHRKRVILFFVFSVLGYMVELGSLSRFIHSIATFNPNRFVLLYSIGNILNLLGIVVLVGFERQIETMKDPKRRSTSIIYLASLVLCIVFALTLHNIIGRILITILIVIQFCAFWWYSLSFIPFAQRLLTNCFSKFKKSADDSIN